MADVGHGLSLALQFYDFNFHIDCGGDKNRYKKAYLNLLCNNPKVFILSHFHSDHYNALVYAKNKKLPNANIEKLYFPRIPESVKEKEHFLKCLFVMNFITLGDVTGSMELDLINLIQSLSDRTINFKPVSQGDIIENGIEILWPPKDILMYGKDVNKEVIKAIEEFETVKENNEFLKEIYKIINVDTYFREWSSEYRNNYFESKMRYYKEIDEKTKKKIKKLNKTFRKVANYFSLAFRLDNDILFMGDLEESDIGIILENIEKDDNHYRVLITPHHGTHWNDNFYKFQFKYAISSEGSKYFGYLNPRFGKISFCFKCTYLCEDIIISENNCNCFRCRIRGMMDC
ncbi:MAG: hypothetical protein GYA62_10885 [Bacteroidales bacterium]|nr:hypothetical protein [Bacteroidales bacterium]